MRVGLTTNAVLIAASTSTVSFAAVEADAAAATHTHVRVVAVGVKRAACACDVDPRDGIVLEVGSRAVSEIDWAEVDDASWGCRLHLKRTTAAHRGAVAPESKDGVGIDGATQRDVEALKCGASVKDELPAGSQADCAVDSVGACGPTFASRPLPNNASGQDYL